MTDPRYRDVAGWLLAQIAADEEVARAATQHPVPASADAVYVRWSRYDTGWVPAASGEWTEGSALFVRWDPARVLAECAAKRKVVRLYQQYVDRLHGPNEVDDASKVAVLIGEAALGRALRLLAQPYRDRDGYRTEWDAS